MLHIALLTIIALCAMTSSPAVAGEDPDALYREGKFAEAEEVYARMDMDRPRDIRYRYNRGCAAYQNGDLKGAAAAFSSVLRRSEDPDIRFNAVYNLGNAAFQQGDVASASKLYQQALRLKPGSEDAMVNLELALRELERMKQQKQEQPENQSQEQQDGKSCPSGKQDKAGDQKKDGDQKEDDQTSQQKPEQEKKEQEAESGTDKSREQQEKTEEMGKTAQAEQREQQGPENLEGELAPSQPMEARPLDGQEAEGAAAAMDRKRAEALLDNMQEDRSRFLRFSVPPDKRRGVASGREW
jgi:Ca-activated chloride channel family protein